MKKEDKKEYYLTDWPAHYYEIQDINEREEILQDVLKKTSSTEDERRLDILQKRFGRAHIKNRPDHFMHALLMLRQMHGMNINALNRHKKEEEFRSYMDELFLFDQSDDLLIQEYHDLLNQYIAVSYKSFSRPAFLGMGKRTGDRVWEEVEKDINIIFSEVPSYFHCQDDFTKLKRIAEEELDKQKNRE